MSDLVDRYFSGILVVTDTLANLEELLLKLEKEKINVRNISLGGVKPEHIQEISHTKQQKHKYALVYNLNICQSQRDYADDIGVTIIDSLSQQTISDLIDQYKLQIQ